MFHSKMFGYVKYVESWAQLFESRLALILTQVSFSFYQKHTIR